MSSSSQFDAIKHLNVKMFFNTLASIGCLGRWFGSVSVWNLISLNVNRYKTRPNGCWLLIKVWNELKLYFQVRCKLSRRSMHVPKKNLRRNGLCCWYVCRLDRLIFPYYVWIGCCRISLIKKFLSNELWQIFLSLKFYQYSNLIEIQYFYHSLNDS